MSWKTIKDYLTSVGYDVKSPRESVKQAFQSDIIVNGKMWLEMLEKRNELTHIYDDELATLAVAKISDEFLPEILQVYSKLKSLE